MRQLEERSKFNVIKTVNDFVEVFHNSLAEKETFVKMLNENFSVKGLSPLEILGKQNPSFDFFNSFTINEFRLKKYLDIKRTVIEFCCTLDKNGTEKEITVSFYELNYIVEKFLEEYEAAYK